MLQRLLRVFYAIEFLIALIAVFTVWGQVGGQVHLDYMAWYWKAGIGVSIASFTVLLTRDLGWNTPAARRRRIAWILALLLLTLCAAGVTYYYHLSEPQDDDESDPGAITPTAAETIESGAVLATFDRTKTESPAMDQNPARPCPRDSHRRVRP